MNKSTRFNNRIIKTLNRRDLNIGLSYVYDIEKKSVDIMLCFDVHVSCLWPEYRVCRFKFKDSY